MRTLQWPPIVLSLLCAKDRQRIIHPGVPPYACVPEIIQGTQNVIFPSRWKRESQEILVDRLPRVVGLEQSMLQDELLRRCRSVLEFPNSIPAAASDVLLYPFCYRQSGVKRAVSCPAPVPPAVEASVRHSLFEDEVNHRSHGFLGLAEVARIVQVHAVYTNVTLHDRSGGLDAAIAGPLGTPNRADALPYPVVIGCNLQVLQVE